MAPRMAACNKRLFHFVAADMAVGSATKTFFFLSSSWKRLRERLSHVRRQEHSWILSWRTSATYCVLFNVALNDEPRRGRKKWGARRMCQK